MKLNHVWLMPTIFFDHLQIMIVWWKLVGKWDRKYAFKAFSVSQNFVRLSMGNWRLMDTLSLSLCRELKEYNWLVGQLPPRKKSGNWPIDYLYSNYIAGWLIKCNYTSKKNHTFPPNSHDNLTRIELTYEQCICSVHFLQLVMN